MKDALIKFLLIFFILVSMQYSQEIPLYVAEKISDEESEALLEYLSDLFDEGIHFSKLSKEEIHDIFYFLEASQIPENHNDIMTNEAFIFFRQFDTHYRSLKNSHHFLYKDLLNSYKSNSDYLGNSSIMKNKHRFIYKASTLDINYSKLRMEKHLSHIYLFLQMKYDGYNLSFGDFKLRNITPLLFSDPYGSIWSEQIKTLNKSSVKVAPRSSISNQNHLRGLTIDIPWSESSQTFVAAGIQEHKVSFYDSVFRSYNFYFPLVKQNQIDIKKTVSEQIVLLNQRLNFWDFQFDFGYLYQSLSENFEKNRLNDKLIVSQSNFIQGALEYPWMNKRIRIDLLREIASSSWNMEFQFEQRMKNNSIQFSAFHYSDDFVNSHSTSWADGTSFAFNRQGYALKNEQQVNRDLSISFAWIRDRKIRDENEDVQVDWDDKFIVQSSWNIYPDLNYHFRWKHNSTQQHSLLYKLNKGDKLKIKYQLRSEDLILACTYHIDNYLIDIQYVNTQTDIQFYRYGVSREFLMEHAGSPSLFFLIKSRSDWNENIMIEAKIDVIYLLEKSEYVSSYYTCENKTMTSITLALHFNL